MKKLLHFITLALTIFFFKNGHAQKYQPYDTNMVWKVFQNGSAWTSALNCTRTDAYNYFVKGYISNNGRLWHKVYANVIQGSFFNYSNNSACNPTFVPVASTQFIGMFSNDTLNKKVHFVPSQTLAPNFTPTDNNLIFDSNNKNIGDTMHVYSGGNPSTTIGLNYKITLIDSVLLGTKYHKRFTGTTTFWQNYSPNYAYFIEGVGSCYGIFNSAFSATSYLGSKLACFSNTNYTKYYTGQNDPYVAPMSPAGNLRDTTVCFTGIITGINSVALNNSSIVLYPNPANDVLNINLNNSQNNFTKIEIINSLGQIVKEVLRQAQQPDENTFVINTKDLPNGVYILNVAPTGLATGMSKRFVIAR